MANSSLIKARSQITTFFDRRAERVYKPSALTALLSEKRNAWNLPRNLKVQAFIEFLTTKSKLKAYDLPFPYRFEQRYVWGAHSLLELLLTVKQDSYYTHLTAARMHGLTNSPTRTIYLNHEQRPHSRSDDLAQPSIDMAFKNAPRISRNSITLDGYEIKLINGMHTNRLGVVEQEVRYDNLPQSKVRLTNLERTLIDIAVRPAYADGVSAVLEIFERAKGRIDCDRLSTYYDALDYVYPYHQVLGYYLECANFPATCVDKFRKRSMKFDFYLTHQMGKTQYIGEWKLHVPRDFRS